MLMKWHGLYTDCMQIGMLYLFKRNNILQTSNWFELEYFIQPQIFYQKSQHHDNAMPPWWWHGHHINMRKDHCTACADSGGSSAIAFMTSFAEVAQAAQRSFLVISWPPWRLALSWWNHLSAAPKISKSAVKWTDDNMCEHIYICTYLFVCTCEQSDTTETLAKLWVCLSVQYSTNFCYYRRTSALWYTML